MRYHWIHNVFDNRFFGLSKVHIDVNGSDMFLSVWRFPPHSCEGEIYWVWAPLLHGEIPKYDYPICLTYLNGEDQFRIERDRDKIRINERENMRETYSHFSATSLAKLTI